MKKTLNKMNDIIIIIKIGGTNSMTKRIWTILFMSIILLSCVGIACAHDTNDTNIQTSSNDTQDVIEDSGTVTAERSGIRNITFSDGYNGYCINMSMHYAEEGSEFTPKDTSHAMNNKYNTPIGNYLKILFVDYYDFAIKDASDTSEVIWDFSDRYYKDSTNEITQAILKDAEHGRTIPDHGATKKINSTTEAVFDFEVFDALNDDMQNYFGYKITFRTIQNTTNETENTTNKTDNTTNETGKTSTNQTDKIITKKENNNTTSSSDKAKKTAETHKIKTSKTATGNPLLLLLIGCAVAIFKREK